MEGYDVEVVGGVSNDLYCTICLKLMRDAIQMKCGHGMCQTCFEKLVASCKERNIEVKEDQNHLMTDCNYHMVKCSFEGCNTDMLKNTLSEHETTCEYRVVQCDYCTDAFLPNQLVNHFEVCEYYPMKCRNEMCTDLIPRCKIEEHLQLDCLYEEVECSFHSIGCGVKFLRKGFNDHLHEFNQKHMLYLLQNTFEKNKQIEALKEESRVVTQSVVETEKRLLIKIDELEKEIHDVKKNSVVINGRLDHYKAEYENVLGKLATIEHKFQDLTCLAPHELTDSGDNQKSVVTSENIDNLIATNRGNVDSSDGICDVQQLKIITSETFEIESKAPMDVLHESFKSESKRHHQQWLSNDLKIIQGITDVKKTCLPLSESYWKIVIDAMKRNSKILNFQQISRMEKYCHFMSSNKELKRFENGKNTVQIGNHSFVRHKYSLLPRHLLKIDVDYYTVELRNFGGIYIRCKKAKEVYIINNHLQKAKLAWNWYCGQWYTVSYNDLIEKEYVVNDWFLLEIVLQM